MSSKSINENKLFTKYEWGALTVMFMSDALIIAGKHYPAGILNWITVIVSACASALIILFVSKLISKINNKMLFNLLIIFISISAIILSLILFSDFVKQCVLPDISPYIIPSGIIITASFPALKNFRTIVKSIHITIPLIVLFIIALILLVSPSLKTEYLYSIFPELRNNILGITKSIIANTILFSLKGIVLLSLFCHEYKDISKNNLTKSFYYEVTSKDNNEILTFFPEVSKGILIYGIIMGFIQLLSLGVLGPGLYQQLDYPLYYPPGLTPLGDYFERAEILSLIMFMTTLIIKTSIYLRAVKMSLSSINTIK